MLRLEHINLVVRDLDESLAFYQAAMPHWQIRGQGEQDWHGTHRRWLHFGEDYQYLTLNDQGTGENRELTSNSVGLSHFAFEVSNLDAIVAQLHKAGFEPAKFGSEEPYRRNVYYIDPNGFEVEFIQYLSDQPAQRNRYS